MERNFNLVLTDKQLDVVMKALNQACNGVEAAALVLPVFVEIQQQANAQLKEKPDGQ